MSDEPLGEWHGVQIGESGRVVNVLLSANNLNGELPQELGNLSALYTLQLSRNRLTGELPSSIGNLTSLTSLGLSDNQLTGELPSSIGNLTSLIHLDLGDNRLTGAIPSSIGNLSNMVSLYLPNNQLSGEIPSELAGLPNLEFLILSGNQWGGCIPLGIAEAVAEESDILWLGIPLCAQAAGGASVTADRAALVALYNATDGPNWVNNTNWLSDEPLREWHGVQIGQAGRVANVLLYENNLNGELPQELGNLSALYTLHLSRNRLTGEIPSSIGNLTSLTSLGLSDNQLTGAIPSSIGNLTGLTHLSLGDNRLSGEIPSELAGLPNLEFLMLSGNQWRGCIPLGIAEAVAEGSDILWWGIPLCAQAAGGASVASDREALVALYNATDGPNWVNNTNWLSDEPPGEWHGVQIGESGRVVNVLLYANNLNGELPQELGNLSALKTLLLSNNRLTGELPSSIGNLTSLKILEMHQNQLTGELPSSIGNLSNLTHLNLSQNQLTGELPSSIGNLPDLVTLFLPDNQLSGEIPSELAGLPNLEFLLLSGNQWGGCIPLGIAEVVGEGSDIHRLGIPLCAQAAGGASAASDREALVALYNATDGPNWFDNTNWLSDEPLGEWHGVSVGQAGRVVVLDLSWNGLSGDLPEELGSLSSLRKLYLHSNELSGQIPSELGSLTLLHELDLHSNELSGQIPSELGNLTPLRELYLHSNELSGQIPSQLGSLTRLRELDLYSNSLSGEMPPRLGNLSSLKWLSLHDNQLRGSIPPEFGELAEVEWMYLSGNSLSGDIPDELGDLPRLSRLLVGGGNRLTGCVPTGLRSVKYADLHELGLPFCGDTDPITVEVPTDLQPPPPSLGLDPYYGKYLDTGGVAIVSSLRVPDQALLSARNILNEMLSDRPDLLTTMAELGIRVAIWDEHAVSSDLPEYNHDMQRDTKALGLFNGIVASTGVESVLCYDNMPEPGFDWLVHELAHAVQAAVEHQPGGDRFRERLQDIYDDARPRWEWTYPGTNPEEFWAELVASWFGLQNAKNYWHDVNSPAELEALEPAVAALIREVFGDATLTSSCHSESSIRGVVVGPDGEPIEGIGVFVEREIPGYYHIGGDWSGWSDGFDVTSADGSFEIPQPDGPYILGIYVPLDHDFVHCGLVGYVTPQGLSRLRHTATQVEVEGADVIGIEIKAPEGVRDLPIIAGCF